MKTKDLVLGAMFVALGLVLPFVTGQIPEIGSKLSPMHFPVFLSGMLLGNNMGLLCGFIIPILRSMIFGMPPMLPAICMAFELATYGFVAGYLYKKKKQNIYVSMIASMLVGRIIWGIVSYIIYSGNFGIEAFMAGAFINAIPGIILQLILIPLIVKRVKL